MSARSIAVGFAFLLLVLACVGRLIHLDADPSFPTWIGYVVDEGRWSETARNLALFNDPNVNWFSRLHLFMSPGYQAVNYVVFLARGVDFWSARLFSAIAGILVVLTVFLALRRRVTALALVFGVVVLGFETNLFWMSRVALPEIPAVLATLIAFLLLALGRKTARSALLAGLVAAVAVALKGSTALVLPIFPVIALIVPQQIPVRARLVRSACFIGGFMLPVVIGATGLFALGYLKADPVGDMAGRFLDFLSLTSPYVSLGRFFDTAELGARNVLLLGVWFCSWLWFYRQRRTPSVLSELYLASGLWAGWWLLVWSLNSYSPGRYLVHFIVPATLHIMAGLSLGGRDSVASIAAGLERRRRLAHAMALSWLVLPSAIVMSSVIAAILTPSGFEVERLSQRVAFVFALTGLMTAWLSVRRIGEATVVGLLSFPIVMTLLWLGGRDLNWFTGFWVFDSAAAIALWCMMAAVTFLLCFFRLPQGRVPLRAAGAAAIALLAATFVAQVAPPVLMPTYSLRDASRDLEQHLPTSRPIRTVTAASLFLENGIKYEELRREDKQIDGLVILEYGGVARSFLSSERADNLIRVHTYPLTISPRYRVPDGTPEVPVIGVYRAK